MCKHFISSSGTHIAALVDALNATRKQRNLRLLEFNGGPYTHARAYEWDMIYDHFGVQGFYSVSKPSIDTNIPRPLPLPLNDDIPTPATGNEEHRPQMQTNRARSPAAHPPVPAKPVSAITPAPQAYRSQADQDTTQRSGSMSYLDIVTR